MLQDILDTDWEAMTSNDWIGMILTVVIFLLMVVAYYYVFNPKNREHLESQKNIPFTEDEISNGEKS